MVLYCILFLRERKGRIYLELDFSLPLSRSFHSRACVRCSVPN